MSVTDGGVTYGCTDSLEDRAYGISYAGRDLARLLMKGGKLPSKYTIAGQEYRVIGIGGASPNGSTNSQSVLEKEVSVSRSGVPTLLVLPPAADYYRYSNHLYLSENTYLVGYGAKVMPLGVAETKFDVNNNSGVIGLTMHALYGAISRWPERFEAANKTVEGAKDGSISKGTDNGDDSAWITMFGKKNCIMFDVATTGSLAGALRCANSDNVLVENSSAFRTHSDSFHFFKEARNITARRNRIYDAGDDAISVVQYTSATGIPRNILVEENVVKGGRARGLTVVSGQDVLYRKNVVEDINLAGYRFGPTGAHSINDTQRIKVQDCQAWRCGRMQTNHTNSGSFAALLSTDRFKCLNVTFQNCKGYCYGDDRYAGGEFVREGNSFGSGGITYTADGNCGIVGIDQSQ